MVCGPGGLKVVGRSSFFTLEVGFYGEPRGREMGWGYFSAPVDLGALEEELLLGIAP